MQWLVRRCAMGKEGQQRRSDREHPTGWRPSVRITKCRLQVSPVIRTINTSAIRLKVLESGDDQACIATISATITGVMRMIRISKIGK